MKKERNKQTNKNTNPFIHTLHISILTKFTFVRLPSCCLFFLLLSHLTYPVILTSNPTLSLSCASYVNNNNVEKRLRPLRESNPRPFAY